MAVVVGVFILCWGPLNIILIVYAACHSCVSSLVVEGFEIPALINSACNPIIYSVFNKDFRHTFKRLLCCQYQCCHSNRVSEYDSARGSRVSTAHDAINNQVLIRNPWSKVYSACFLPFHKCQILMYDLWTSLNKIISFSHSFCLFIVEDFPDAFALSKIFPENEAIRARICSIFASFNFMPITEERAHLRKS